MATAGSPRVNRVAPDSTLHAVPDRGSLFGNRGQLLRRDGTVGPLFQVTRWIVCELEFRGQRLEPWRPDVYTGLFFLDEATAFAAGHRPCALCRGPAFTAYADAWQRATGSAGPPRVPEMDAVLHADRLVDRTTRRTFEAPLADLPDGTVVGLDDGWWLVDGPVLRHWTFGGYDEARDRSSVAGPVPVVTPRATVEALRAGYRPGTAVAGGVT